MIKLVQITEENAEVLTPIFLAHQDLFGDLAGSFYLGMDNGNIKVICHTDNAYIVYYYQGEDLYYDTFFVDENNKVQSLLLDEYTISISENPMFTNVDTNIVSLIEFIKRPNGVDVDGYDALLTYVQYNPENDARLLITKQYMSSHMGTIYPNLVKERKPFQISIQKGNRKKDYAVRIAKEGEFVYDLMTIREYGLLAFLKHGSYSLQKEKTLTRYFKVYGISPNDYAVTFFPITIPISLEKIEKEVAELGFSLEIPSEIIDAYNENDHDFSEYEDIAKVVGEVEAKQMNPTQLILKRGQNNDE